MHTDAFAHLRASDSFDYFPLAMKIADDMRALGGTDRFIYTTHPFLVSIYLDCPQFLTLAGNVTLRCPSAGEIANFTAAMQRGDIVMHAGPFNLQPENMSPQLFRDSLRLAPALAKRLGGESAVGTSNRCRGGVQFVALRRQSYLWCPLPVPQCPFRRRCRSVTCRSCRGASSRS